MLSNKKVRLFKIYALLHEQHAFIGKTQGELDPVVYQHRRAQNPFTAEYFYPKNSKDPSIHILEHISCNSSESYRHIVAWVRIFQDAGYQIINPQGTIDDANDLHTPTANLVKKLCPISLDVLLYETQHKKLRNGSSPLILETPKTEQVKKVKHREKITLWATPEEKERFVAYANSLGFTQAQTLQYLISKIELETEDPLFPDWDGDIFTRNREESYKREKEGLEKTIYKLQTQLHTCKQAITNENKKLTQCYAIAKNAIAEVFRSFDSTAVLPLDIERGRYREYMPNLPIGARYAYPDRSGASFLRLHAFLLGDGTAPARFVCGVDEQNRRIMLRFYPSEYFIGINPGNTRFSQRNSVWYMAWRRSGDVAELIAAFPMQLKAKYQNPMDEDEKMHSFIDQLMAEVDSYNAF